MRFAVLPPVDVCPVLEGPHVDGVVSETDDGAPVYECVGCAREVVKENDGSFVEVAEPKASTP